MSIKLFSALFGLTTVIISCKSIRIIDYLKIQDNKRETFNGVFIKTADDVHYKIIEQLFGSVSSSDTVIEITEIIYKSINIEGHKAFYAIETIDTIKKNPNIGPRHFLYSAMLFFKDTTFIAPVFDKEDLNKLRFADFKFKIPPSVTNKDSVVIIDRKKRMVLYNFHKTSLSIGKNKFTNCLFLDIRDEWHDALYGEKVWVHKKHGVLKWVRSTGRTETRVF